MVRYKGNLAEYWRRLLSWPSAQQLRADGYRVGVLHLHSSYSRDVPSLRENNPDMLIEKGMREGADYIAITDHDNDDAWRNAGERPACWIRGVEMEVFDKKRIGHPIHLGMLNISDDKLSDELHELALVANDADRLVSTALSNGVTVIANHPWWGPRGYHINSIRYWHFIERYRLPVELNEKRSFVENFAALTYASHRGLPIVAATDSHTRKLLPTCTLAKGDTPEEFLASIRAGDTYVVPSFAGLVDMPAMMARYVLDVIKCPLTEDLCRVPMKLNAAPLVDRIMTAISSGDITSKVFQNPLMSMIAGPLTYFVGAFLYIPTVYATSSMKVLRDIYERSSMAAALPELISE